MNASQEPFGVVWFMEVKVAANPAVNLEAAEAELLDEFLPAPALAQQASIQCKPKRVGDEFLVVAVSPSFTVWVRFSRTATSGHYELQHRHPDSTECGNVVRGHTVQKGEKPWAGVVPSIYEHGFLLTTKTQGSNWEWKWFIGFTEFETVNDQDDAAGSDSRSQPA